jgi:hypothetical protein
MTRFVVARRLATLAVVAVALPTTSGLGAVERAGTVSPKLVGSWTRTVSSADAKHAAAPAAIAGSVWTLEIEKDGTVAVFDANGAGSFEGTARPTGADRVKFDLGTGTSAIYRWHVANGVLTFAKVSDTDRDRIVVFVGSWKRK